MAAPDNTDQVDILPMLLLGLAVIYLFYLLRPPVLMFWHYGLGMSKPPAEQITQKTPGVSAHPRVATPPPARAPALPTLLQQPVATWRKAPPPDSEIDALDQAIEGLTNQMRQKYGRQDLQIDPELRKIATLHSWDMLDRGYLDHNSPDGVSPAQRVGKQHRRLFGLIGENVALVSGGVFILVLGAVKWLRELWREKTIIEFSLAVLNKLPPEKAADHITFIY